MFDFLYILIILISPALPWIALFIGCGLLIRSSSSDIPEELEDAFR